MMGIYLNPGNDGFWEAVNSKIYVDKTNLIACTNELIGTEQKFICVSRPRRFGKSMTLKMLAAYYSRGCNSKTLFEGRKIEKEETFQKHLNQYDVIYLNMQQFLIEAESRKLTKYLEEEVCGELQEEYGELLTRPDIGLAASLRKIYAKTGKKFIFLIDEWDCVMRERQNSEAMQKQYLDFLRNLLKDQPYVALAYMTGILPVKKYGEHSALNMFTEYSMTDQDMFEEYTGFTEAEVKALCEHFNMDFTETSNWYDGYMFTEFGHVYNPKSVVEAMRRRKFSNYWTSTEVYDALKNYITMDFDGLREDVAQMLGGGHIAVNIRSFRNDMCNFEVKDDVLTLLIHLGYLAYDSHKMEVFIPNREIAGEFETAMSVKGWSEVMRVLKASEKLLADTLSCNEKSVAEGLDRAHTEISSILTYNDENALGAAIGLAYYSARKDYTLIRELPTGKGFADIVFLPLPHTGKPALVIELKYDKAAASAIQQIKDRHYTQALERYVGEILLVGIDYNRNSADKPHSCVIEKVEKTLCN
ncbi:MAG: ATP-binding protein [Candidatus Gastranaerophilales bacterium]|nr:ATP-binding protein [Candidatus Gastranaerophilales bacterium]